MRSQETLIEIRTALDAMSVFHRLRHAREAGTPLSAREASPLRLIRDAFEPLRVVGSHMTRKAIRLPVARAATVAVQDRVIAARATVLALRRVELECAESLRLGDCVDIAIASVGGRRWYTFHGRIVRPSACGRGETIALLPMPARYDPLAGRGAALERGR